jgi:fructokinase
VPARFTIVGLGELLWDLFPDGSRRLGGAPANVAFHASALGDSGVLLSRVGRDAAGDEALRQLGRRGVDVSGVQRDPGRPTGVARVHLCTPHGPEPHFAVDVSAAWVAPEWSDAWASLVASCDVLCFGTLLCGQPAGRRVVESAAAAAPGGALRLLDLNLRPPHTPDAAVDAALELASVVKLSEEEAAALGARLGVPDVAAHLLGRGLRAVALTRGEGGSVICTPDGRNEHPGLPLPEPEPGRDAVGAGDAFTAALAHHLVRGHPLAQTNIAANRYAAFVASRAGATPEAPEALRRQVRGEP